jgi:hypothetical protein
MDTSLGPHLEGLGAIPALHVDFARLAALVFFADRTVPRPRGWTRELSLDVAVSNPGLWADAADELAGLLYTLTGDVWDLTFSRRRGTAPGDCATPAQASQVSLFSGGADSGAGSLLAVMGDPATVLVSHSDWTSIRGQQNALLDEIEQITGSRPNSSFWRLARRPNQVGSNQGFREEPSRRSRSIVFLALGLAVASLDRVPLLVPENGFTSLNPPLSGERRGSLSTRTTHPAFLDGVQAVLTGLGLHADVRNPFESLTKGEVFEAVKQKIGVTTAAAFLSTSNSCAKPDRSLTGFAPDTPCGVCLGCLVRRGAFMAAGLTDTTTYKESALHGDTRRAQWLTPKRRETYASVQYRAGKDYAIDDILALGLPDRWDPEDALALARRGLAELKEVRIQ